mmetsp:Transcript_15565/g.46097  ORF Transcript_15565/g.46097 Transcript_15565/m.46097 type:complete len:80 (+) Transcript_15565:553-792(+)
MSAELRPATEDDPQDRLVNGMVQRVGGVAKVDGAQASQAEGDATAESLLTIGEFGGIAQLEAEAWTRLGDAEPQPGGDE